jgi:hypothetical protein
MGGFWISEAEGQAEQPPFRHRGVDINLDVAIGPSGRCEEIDFL